MTLVPRLVPFTDNVRDLSTTEGYQFEFSCERCGNGHRSAFRRDKVEFGRDIARAFGSFLGGRAERVTDSVQNWGWGRSNTTGSAAKDRALAAAVEEVRDQFRQCRGCSNWMCVDQCWNQEIGQCLTCSPSVAEEVSRAQAEAQRQQIWDKARQNDWTKGVDTDTRAHLTCPDCGTKVAGGKFCSSCGAALHVAVRCAGCGFDQNGIGAMFCSGCGQRL